MNDSIFFDYFFNSQYDPLEYSSCDSEEDEAAEEIENIPMLLQINTTLAPVILRTILADFLIAKDESL